MLLAMLKMLLIKEVLNVTMPRKEALSLLLVMVAVTLSCNNLVFFDLFLIAFFGLFLCSDFCVILEFIQGGIQDLQL